MVKSTADVESVTAWLNHGAPAESVREAVAIETNLGDPDLLPPPPSIRSSLGAVLRSPREAFIVFSAWVGVIASVVAAAVPLVLEGRGACGYAIAIRLCCIFAGTHMMNMLGHRYVLYVVAVTHQVYKGATLGSVTAQRLAFRGRRCCLLSLYALVSAFVARSVWSKKAAGCDAYCCPGVATNPADERWALAQLAGAAIALPSTYLVVYVLWRDPLEEASIRSKQHSNCREGG